MAIGTENIPEVTGGGIQKIIQPGDVVAKINSVVLESADKFKPGAMNVLINVETPPLENFEGFFIDKDDESKGRHLGQVGRIKASQWAIADFTPKGGTLISRDTEIMKIIKQICVAVGAEAWLKAQNNKHETIEAFVAAFEKEKPYAGIFVNWCVGGREYYGAKGHKNFDLYLPKPTPKEAVVESTKKDKPTIMKFNAAVHIIAAKPNAAVEEFAEPATATTEGGAPVDNDFDLP